MSVPWVPAVDESVSTAVMPPLVLVKRVTFGKVEPLVVERSS
jgi:hypothetical protein